MDGRINKYKYPGAKRLMLEAQELKDKTEDYCAQPIDDNLFEWHFTVRGPPETAFEGGFYHGRLSFPTEYPMKPPSIILLTPNGRFETNKKICLSISGYHPETWQPSWSVRTALLALIAFMPTKSHRAIGSLDFPDAERRKLARNSRSWRCETCGPIKDLLKHPEELLCNASKCGTGGPSRVAETCPQEDEQVERKSLSSDSEGENRDISANFQESSSSTNGSDSDGGDSTTGQSRTHEQQIANDDDVDDDDVDDSVDDNNVDDEGNTYVAEDRRPDGQSSSAPQQTIDSKGSSSVTLATNNAGEHNLSQDERRRSYPPLVFISISVLLFLLILRRVVMIVQA